MAVSVPAGSSASQALGEGGLLGGRQQGHGSQIVQGAGSGRLHLGSQDPVLEQEHPPRGGVGTPQGAVERPLQQALRSCTLAQVGVTP